MSLLALLSALQLAETSSFLEPDDIILRRRSSRVEQSALRHSNCTDSVCVQQPAQDSFVLATVMSLVTLFYCCTLRRSRI